MKTLHAEFTLQDRQHGKVRVLFCFTPAGTPTHVAIAADQVRYRLDNAAAKYKPCVTHAIEAVRLMLGQPPRSNFERRRRSEAKPHLRVHRG